jgi:hypothetical protein
LVVVVRDSRKSLARFMTWSCRTERRALAIAALGTRHSAEAAFPETSALALVEFAEGHDRRLGIQVTCWAQGEAVVACIQANMRDEKPRLLCFEPTHARQIPLDVGVR